VNDERALPVNDVIPGIDPCPSRHLATASSRHRVIPQLRHLATASARPPRHPARSRRIHTRKRRFLGRGFRDDARNDMTAERRRSSITKSNARASTPDSRQARPHVSAMAAGSVAASKARRCPKQSRKREEVFVPTAWVNRRCGGRVLGETQHRAIEGIAGVHTKPPNATRRRRADEFHRTPSESGRPGRIQGARAESSQVHARRAAARAPHPREASHPHFIPPTPHTQQVSGYWRQREEAP
jgi:hypothetical protein